MNCMFWYFPINMFRCTSTHLSVFLGVWDRCVLAQEDADNSLPGDLTQRRKRCLQINIFSSWKWQAYTHCQSVFDAWNTVQVRDEKVVEWCWMIFQPFLHWMHWHCEFVNAFLFWAFFNKLHTLSMCCVSPTAAKACAWSPRQGPFATHYLHRCRAIAFTACLFVSLIFVDCEVRTLQSVDDGQAMYSLGIHAPWVDVARRFFSTKVAQLLEDSAAADHCC